MKPCILATLISCIPVAYAQVPPNLNPSEVVSGIISGQVYDVTLRNGAHQTGCISSKLDSKGNGSIISWPDGGSVTVTRIHNGSAVIFGPSR